MLVLTNHIRANGDIAAFFKRFQYMLGRKNDRKFRKHPANTIILADLNASLDDAGLMWNLKATFKEPPEPDPVIIIDKNYITHVIECYDSVDFNIEFHDWKELVP